MSLSRPFLFLPTAIALLLLPSCGNNPATQPPVQTILREATLSTDQTIPLPTDETLITIRGKIQNTNQDETLLLDRETIESLQLVQFEIFDLFERKNVTFEGVLLQDLIKLWQIDPEATSLEMVALNDYQINLPLASLEEVPMLFALKQDGQYMQPDYRGPAMLIVPHFGNSSTFEHPRPYYWIWQISTITVQ